MSAAGASATGATRRGAALRVVAVGIATSVQDAGRAGWAHLGVPTSGAADRASHRLANRLVGNPESCAAIETCGGLELEAEGGALRVAVTGAEAPLTLDGHAADQWRPLALAAGAHLRIGAPPRGLRIYVSVAGGVGGPRVLGSRSADVLAGLVPVPVTAGARLEVDADGPSGRGAAEGLVAVAVPPAWPDWLDVWPGPHAGDLDAATRSLVATTRWTVSPESDRVGVRLAGPAIAADGAAVVPTVARESEPLVRGAVQAPPSGGLVVMLADHPTTGGYPVVGVVDDASVDALAQSRPGDAVRLRWVGAR